MEANVELVLDNVFDGRVLDGREVFLGCLASVDIVSLRQQILRT